MRSQPSTRGRHAFLAAVIVCPFLVTAVGAQADEAAFRIDEIPAQRLIAREMRGPYDQHPQAIIGLLMYVQQQGLRTSGPLTGVYPDDPSAIAADDLRWLVGLPLDDAHADLTLPQPYHIEPLPAIRAVVVETVLSRIEHETDLAQQWMAEADLVQAAAVRMLFVDDDHAAEDMRVKVLIPVEPRPRTLADASLDKLAFLVGEWRGEMEGNRIIERWSAPLGDAMLGAFQWVRPNGLTWMYELQSITLQEGGIVLFIRHFDAEFQPWEPPDRPLRFHLSGLDEREAVFSRPADEELAERDARMLIFRRVGDDELHILLIARDADESDARRFEFLLER